MRSTLSQLKTHPVWWCKMKYCFSNVTGEISLIKRLPSRRSTRGSMDQHQSNRWEKCQWGQNNLSSYMFTIAAQQNASAHVLPRHMRKDRSIRTSGPKSHVANQKPELNSLLILLLYKAIFCFAFQYSFMRSEAVSKICLQISSHAMFLYPKGDQMYVIRSVKWVNSPKRRPESSLLQIYMIQKSAVQKHMGDIIQKWPSQCEEIGNESRPKLDNLLVSLLCKTDLDI